MYFKIPAFKTKSCQKMKRLTAIIYIYKVKKIRWVFEKNNMRLNHTMLLGG